uniref:tRNA/rRNA methyltransferase SpoU type domain-containing protein n=1 Tax=Populus trichocarpa TaxID=3694 RepID=A0A2K2A3D8_POPTR
MRWGIYKESTRRVVGVVKDKLSGYGYNEREDSVEGGEAEEELEENRGRKTWKEATESTVPKIVGEGVYGVLLCAKNSALLSGVVSKASAGSLELMELRCCKNRMQFLASSAENGWRVLGGSVSSKAVPLNEVLPGQPTILVLGSEGTGDEVEGEEINLERSSAEFGSFLAVESLNVSVAAGVLLHHLIGNNDENLCTGHTSTVILE